MKKIIQAYLKGGVSEVSISEAPGMAAPGQVYGVMVKLQVPFPEVKYILHFRNARGMAGGCPFVPAGSKTRRRPKPSDRS